MSDDSTAEIPMVNVQIDGVWHQVPKGTRMIEAIRMARGDGTTVPHGPSAGEGYLSGQRARRPQRHEQAKITLAGFHPRSVPVPPSPFGGARHLGFPKRKSDGPERNDGRFATPSKPYPPACPAWRPRARRSR